MNKTRAGEFFRVCNPCVFYNDCCVCKTCTMLTKNNFTEEVKKISEDFKALEQASFDILVSQGCESNHDEILRIIRDDQANKATELLVEVASIMSDLLKTVEKNGLAGAEMTRAKELIGRVNRFLNEAIESCGKSFGKFNEPNFLKEARLLLSQQSS